jgi:hypothetical protein
MRVSAKCARLMRRVWFGTLALVLAAVDAPSGGAMELKPKPFPLMIFGVRVAIPVTISFDMQTAGDSLNLQLRAEGNLKDIQDKALEIARALPVPKGNCDREGVNPVVNSIDSASITPRDNTAVVAIAGRVTAWACAKVLGSSIKTETVSDSVALTAPVEILIVDGKQLRLKLASTVSVKTGNALTAEVANLLAGDISASITSALASALNANEARASVPNVPGLEVNIQNAQFAADGNVLLVRANGTARMSSESFSTFLGLLTK